MHGTNVKNIKDFAGLYS